MVLTDKSLLFAMCLPAQPIPTMPADVDERTDFPAFILSQQHRHANQFPRDERPDVGQFCFIACDKRILRKKHRLLCLKHRLIFITVNRVKLKGLGKR
ncbi:hypothetical protein D3C72_1944440 [compost metagenome]